MLLHNQLQEIRGMLFRYAIISLLCHLSRAQGEGAPKLQTFDFPARIKIGDSTTITCAVNRGQPPFIFKWYKNGISIESKSITSSINQKFSTLLIDPVKETSSGNYTCEVANKFGKDTQSASLAVRAPPMWKLEPEDAEVVEGQRLDIKCSASGFPSPRITWKKMDTNGGTNLVSSDLPSNKNGSLSVQRVLKHHEGSYTCEAENGAGDPIRKIITVIVHVPARFEEKFSVVTVKKGDSASLRCTAIGDQPLSVTWQKESKEMRKINGGRYEIFETLTPQGLKSELVLREADRTDGQLYTCITENPYGKDERSIKLLVMEVPATPLDLKVIEVWSRSTSVTWSPPYAGNSPITRYILQYWRDSVSGGRHRLEEKAVTSAQTSALIKDLHPGTSYGLAVIAENTVGRGEPSDVVMFSTGEEEPSGPPMDVNVDVKGATSLLVTWKAPPKSEWNGRLRGYYVGYRATRDSSHPYSFKTVEYTHSGEQEHMITSLRKDTEYSIIVKAFNSAGSSPSSQEVIVSTLGGEFPLAPVVFVVATSENSIKIQWRSPDNKIPVSGHAVHYRKKGDTWQRVAVTSPTETSYTLNGLLPSSLYQLYVTANSDYGEGDPSDVVTVKTQGPLEQVVLLAGTPEQVFDMDISLLIPVLASLLAVTVVIVAVCIWVMKAKSRRNLERAIQEDKRYIYAAATQRYVDIDKTRSLPAYADGTLLHFPTPYATVQMAEDLNELMKEDRQQEMKAFLPQNVQDRPLPSKPGSKKRESLHIYDSAQ